MRVPVTDAFDDSDQLESLEVSLTTEQLEWLREKAEEQDLSLDHMLRSVINAQMRSQDEPAEEPSAPPISGDGQPLDSPSSSSNDTNAESNDGPSSIVESLRSASKRLQNLTEEEIEENNSSDPADTLERLQARLGNASGAEQENEEEAQGSFVVENQSQSMFDMMDDE